MSTRLLDSTAPTATCRRAPPHLWVGLGFFSSSRAYPSVPTQDRVAVCAVGLWKGGSEATHASWMGAFGSRNRRLSSLEMGAVTYAVTCHMSGRTADNSCASTDVFRFPAK
jgi:hypothetical protein